MMGSLQSQLHRGFTNALNRKGAFAHTHISVFLADLAKWPTQAMESGCAVTVIAVEITIQCHPASFVYNDYDYIIDRTKSICGICIGIPSS